MTIAQFAADLFENSVLRLDEAAQLGMLVVSLGSAAACIVLYGMGSGIRSIARGTVPLAIFGREAMPF